MTPRFEQQLPMLPRYSAGNGRVFPTVAAAVDARPGAPRFRLDHRIKFRMRRGFDFAHESRALQEGCYTRPTMVEGVHAVPQFDPATCNLDLGKGPGDADLEPRVALDALMRSLLNGWRPGGKHVVAMSSGFDSRVLVKLLHTLWQQLDQSWLGEVRFVTWEPEIDAARRIWDHIGWGDADADVTFCPLIDMTEGDYYAAALGWHVNRDRSDSTRFFAGPLKAELWLGGWLDESVQGMAATYHDELAGYWHHTERGPLATFVAAYMLDEPSLFPLTPGMDWLLPYVSRYYVRLLQESSWRTRCNNLDGWKRLLCMTLDPELLMLPNVRFQIPDIRNTVDGIHLPHQRLSDATRLEMAGRYASSWYAQQDGTPDAVVFPEYVAWESTDISHYLRAAICSRWMG